MSVRLFGCAMSVLIVASTVAGCNPAAEPEAPTMTRHTVIHDGLEREYFVFLPSSYDSGRAMPVSIFLHGYGGTATGTEAETTQGLNFYAEKYGHVMVYPQSTWFMDGDSDDTRWEVTSWNHISDGFDSGPDGPICIPEPVAAPCPPECGSCGQCGWASCNDDVGFLKRLVTDVSGKFRVDSERIYITGFSNGAMMANRIACEASDLFAAVALVGGRVEPGFECMPQNALPLLQINGGKDSAVPFDGRPSDGGYLFASTVSIEEHWTDAQACAAARTEWSLPAIAGQNVQCTIACGDTDSPMIDCIWPEGNHRWPGTPGYRGSGGYCVTQLQSASMPEQTLCVAPDPDVAIWGSDLLFQFFDLHPR